MSNLWKSTRRWLPGVLTSLIAIAAILYFIDLQRFINAVQSANYWLLFWAFVCSVIWLVVRGIVWRTILRGRATYRDVFLTISEGYLLNNFLPFKLGEVGRAFLLGRKAKLGFMDVFSTIVIERAIDLAFAAVILLTSIPFVVGAAGAGQIGVLLGVIVLFGLLVLYMLARNQDWAMGQFNKRTIRSPRLQKMGEEFLTPLFSGLSILTDGWLFVRVLLWMVLNWAIAIVEFFILILAFFPQATPIWSLFGLGAVAFGNAIPSLPGAVGTFEGALAGAITILSGDQSTALAVALTSHFYNYLSTGIIGLYALSSEGETLMGIYRQLQKKQDKATTNEK
jgi:uncharacterized protein (TIRG00374 family)